MRFSTLALAASSAIGAVDALGLKVDMSHATFDIDLDQVKEPARAPRMESRETLASEARRTWPGQSQRDEFKESRRSSREWAPKREPSMRVQEDKLGKYDVYMDHGIHRGILSDDGETVTFHNVPYAFAPNDTDSRWYRPMSPMWQDGVHDGMHPRVRMCPQAIPGWVPYSGEFFNEFKNLYSPLDPKWEKEITEKDYKYDFKNTGDEDCLYMDISVPRIVWDQRNQRNLKPATVVWIHGGGFTYGSKHDIVSPQGLFQAANMTDDNEPMIFVSINYRLGMFGFLGGPKAMQELGTVNLGLLDQAQALRYVTSYISAFGGRPDRVTAMGQSAGASSIMWQMTRGAGQSYEKPTFNGAILQSPGYFPNTDNDALDSQYNEILKLGGVKDIEELANLTSHQLKEINYNMTFGSTWGQFAFGPSVGGYEWPDLPSRLFKEGRFHKEITALIGYTTLDGVLFTPPWVRTMDGLKNLFKNLYKDVPDSVLNKIEEMYKVDPPQYGGVSERISLLQVADLLDDIAIQCNAYYMNEALFKVDSLRSFAYRYQFDAVPPIHGHDLNYIFYPETAFNIGVDADKTLAQKMQRHWVDFIRYRDVNLIDKNDWPRYDDKDRKIMRLGHFIDFNSGEYRPDFEQELIKDTMDDAGREKCAYWQDAPYIPSKGKSRGFEKLVVQDGRRRAEF